MRMKKATKKKKLSVVERMIQTKRALIARLEADIKDAYAGAREREQALQFNIRRAKVILSALEKGTLKP